MHRLNIFLSRSGPRAGRAPFLLVHCLNPNLSFEEYNYIFVYHVKYFSDTKRKQDLRAWHGMYGYVHESQLSYSARVRC